MFKKLDYGTISIQKGGVKSHFFCILLLLFISIFTCFFNTYFDVNAENVEFNLSNNTKINVHNNNADRVIYGGSINGYVVEGSISVFIDKDLYNGLMYGTPSISLIGFYGSYNSYNLRFVFNDIQSFSYVADISSIDDYNYTLYSAGFMTKSYCLVFALPFDFSLIYDATHSNNPLDIYTYSGANNMLFADMFSGYTYIETDQNAINNLVCDIYDFRATLNSAGTTYDKDYCYTYSLDLKKYNVNFYDIDNRLLSSQSVNENSFAVVPTAPIIEGYDFIGWTSSENGISITSPIIQDVNFTATYKIKQYSVVYKDYDGSIIDSQLVSHGMTSVVPNNPHRVGYTFLSWICNVSEYNTNSVIYQDVIFTADYKINQYSVTFLAIDKSIIKSFVCDYGSYVSVPDSPTIVGYTFVCWISESGFDVNSAITQDVTFIASYSLNKYIVDFKDEEGNIEKSIIVDHGNIILASDIPLTDKKGYRFLGWNSSVSSLNIESQILSDVVFTKSYEIIPEFWDGVDYASDLNYENGFNDGVLSVDTNVSYNEGYNSGYTSGYGVGFSDGESAGLNTKGTFSSLMYSIIDAPFNVLSNALNFEIFGINLSYFLIAIISLLLVFFVIRKLL